MRMTPMRMTLSSCRGAILAYRYRHRLNVLVWLPVSISQIHFTFTVFLVGVVGLLLCMIKCVNSKCVIVSNYWSTIHISAMASRPRNAPRPRIEIRLCALTFDTLALLSIQLAGTVQSSGLIEDSSL